MRLFYYNDTKTMTTALKPAVQISSDDFVSHFQTSFLETLNVLPWQRKLGTKDRLHSAKPASLYAIFVGNDLAYTKESILCWARVLENYGLLLLEASSETLPELIQSFCPTILTYVENQNPNVWVFQKRTQKSLSQIADEFEQKVQDNAPLDTIFALLDEYEQLAPTSSFPCFARQKLLSDRQLPTLAEMDW